MLEVRGARFCCPRWGRRLADVEIVTRVERRRKWKAEEKAALLAEVDAEGGKVMVVARRHRIPESVLYNWRSAQKAASSLAATDAVEFVPLGVFGGPTSAAPAMLAAPDLRQPRPPSRRRRGRAGAIEIALPDGTRVCVDRAVDEAALSRVLRAMRSLT
jgi:transposase